jgi:hypothetical protein
MVYAKWLIHIFILTWTGLDSNVDGRQDDISRSGLSRTSKTLKCFKLKELKTATRNLISDSQVSEEELYVKGWIDENTLGPTKPGSGFTIAVKKLNHVSHQEPSEWLVSTLFENFTQSLRTS